MSCKVRDLLNSDLVNHKDDTIYFINGLDYQGFEIDKIDYDVMGHCVMVKLKQL